jgi:hypothetical protein
MSGVKDEITGVEGRFRGDGQNMAQAGSVPLLKSSDLNVLQEFLIWNRSLSPADRKAKFCAMVQNPFSFFRGKNMEGGKFSRNLKIVVQQIISNFKLSTATQFHNPNFKIDTSPGADHAFSPKNSKEPITPSSLTLNA